MVVTEALANAAAGETVKQGDTGMETLYRQREANEAVVASLIQQGAHELEARLLAGRGVKSIQEVDMSAAGLLMPGSLLGSAEAGDLLADAIVAGERICVVADYDCDGASACAVLLRGLRMLGARSEQLVFVVPDRQVHGYGLTPGIVDEALSLGPDVIVTVDNGIASFDGVKHARAKGKRVVVTDHHLPAAGPEGEVLLPEADVVVNPNQPGCPFGSKNLCGAGVAFYVLSMTRSALRLKAVAGAWEEANLGELLDLVALATIADVVRLDGNNRRLVALGLKRIRSGRASPGIRALMEVSGVNWQSVGAQDLGFRIGPRVNAAGRLSDMSMGIECLSTDDQQRAAVLAGKLQEINAERKQVEAGMTEAAQYALARIGVDGTEASICVFNEAFHEGVIGIVAGRLKERWHRPSFVLALSTDGKVKGSGRSIPGVHLRDVLDLISKREPGILLRFGGHAAAAGVALDQSKVDRFAAAFERACEEAMAPELRQRVVLHDGGMPPELYDVGSIDELNKHVWGNGFEPPVFIDRAEVLEQRLVGGKHLKLAVRVGGQRREGIWFNRTDVVQDRTELVYRVDVNEWNGCRRPQMMVIDECES